MQAIATTRQHSREINFIARGKHLTKIEEYTLLALSSTCAHFKKLYCWIARETIREHVCKWYGHPVSLSTIDRAIRRLRDLRLIRRQLRPARPNTEGKEWTSSLTFLTARVKYLLEKLLRLPRSISACFRLSSVTNYLSLTEKVSGWGTPLGVSPKPREDLKGCPAGSNSSYLTPEHHFPDVAKAELRKLGIL